MSYYEKEARLEAKEIIKKLKPHTVDLEKDGDWFSVCVEDETTEMRFWIDIEIEDGEIVQVDWNDYIFSMEVYDDTLRNILQSNSDFYEEMVGEAENFLYEKGYAY